MLEPKTVLVPTDFSRCSLRALDYGWELARKHQAELLLVHACSAEADAARARERLADLAATLEPLCRRTALHLGPAVEFLEFLSLQERDPVIVMATHGRRGMTRRLLGSTAEGVVSRALCPVLTVKDPGGFLDEVMGEEPDEVLPGSGILELGKARRSPEDAYFARQDRMLVAEARKRARERQEALHGRQHHGFRIQRILVPTDFTDRSRQALDQAAAWAAAHGAEIVMLHVLEEGLRGRGRPAREAQRQEVAAVLLGRLGEGLGASAWQAVVDSGPAARTIVRQASNREVDLVVMATRGRRAMAGLALGSTARRVVRRAPCPVLTIRGAEVAQVRQAAG